MNRRELLLASLAAASPMAAAPASPRIRVAMLGTEHSHAAGKRKVLEHSTDYELAAVCELGPRAEELLADASIQVVVVEGKPWEVVEWGAKVIGAGKHLHLEKPPGNQMAPFRKLVEEARDKKLLLQVGYIWRFHQGIAAAFAAARQGYLGEVFSVRGTINTDLQPAARADLARFRSGMMFELGCHIIDRVVDLLDRPVRVHSRLRHDTSIADALADNTLAVLEYDKAMAVVSSAARQAGASQHRSFEILGANGSIVIQPVEPGTKMQVTLREAHGPYKAGSQQIDLPPQPRYAGDFRDLARAIRTHTPLQFSYDHELLVEETLLRACGEPLA
jgi:predicted dehydrogenase